MDYLESITINKKPTERLKKLAGVTIDFVPGINLIVGENGSGKSSLLDIIRRGDEGSTKIKTSGSIKTCFFDTEKMNPRIKSYGDTPFEISTRFISHGECLKQCLVFLEEPDLDANLIFVDEPESGLSPKSQKELAKTLVKTSEKYQIIIATHSIVIAQIKVGRLIELGFKKVNYYDPPKTYDWKVL